VRTFLIPRFSSRAWLVFGAALVLGSAVRVVLAFAIYGATFDIDSLAIVAGHLPGDPVVAYETDRWPYPPGFFPLLELCDAFASATGLPFHGVVQLPSIVADAALAWLVAAALLAWRRNEAVALAGGLLVALGPSFALISGYHGQIDSVAILPAVAGVIAWRELGSRRALPAGALIGLGAAVKTVPLFVVLPLLAGARDARERIRLVAAAVAVPLLVTLPLLARDPAPIVDALTSNRGVPGFGGLSAFVDPETTRTWAARGAVEPSQALHDVTSIQNLLVAGAVLALAVLLWRRRVPPLEGLVLLWLTVYVVNPNFAFQYLVWGLPFFVLAGWLWGALAVQAAFLVPGLILYADPPLGDDGWTYLVLVQLAWLAVVALWLRRVAAAWRGELASERL
jgi:hypothetical protein